MTENILIECPDPDFDKIKHKEKNDKIVARNRRYRDEHREQHRKYMRELMKNKMQNDPDFRERQLACKRESFKKIYERKKAKMVEDGIVPKPRGRPKRMDVTPCEIVV
jgi:hypothetical protein